MIINNARGSHSSPGVYTKEVDINYSVKSLGITSLGLAGETLKGPAFEPIKIEKWSEFVDYFGSTSAEKVKGTGLPKYELPYIAKEYLKESKQLYVCRALGLSGYNAGPAWAICVNVSGTETLNGKYPIVILRSKGEYTTPSGTCGNKDGDELKHIVTGITIAGYTGGTYVGDCEGYELDPNSIISEAEMLQVNGSNMGKFTISAQTVDGKTYVYPVSLNSSDKDYIYNVLGTSPLANEAPIFVEEVYDYALKQLFEEAFAESTASTVSFQTGDLTKVENENNYKEMFKCACTPWLVSQVNTNDSKASARRLFRAYTISDGNEANTEVKLSIEKIRPDEGTFDLVVRAMNDNDGYPIVLEKFSGCNLIPGDKNYLPLRVGSYDGVYELKSKYIAIEVSEDDEIIGAVPCGFEGYPIHKFSGCDLIPTCYNKVFDFNVKAKRQYFGFSNITGIDYDLFSYKGVLSGETHQPTAGFHMDAIVSVLGNKVWIDGKAYDFESVDTKSEHGYAIPRITTEKDMEDTIYEDIATRKFTVCFFGGFDGWDIYRKQRTTSDKFKATKYTGKEYTSASEAMEFIDLPANAITSDYYAYLGAYRQFSNPENIDINVFATPGIDWLNNELLVEDALDMVEDPDDGRRGDSLYIITSPMTAVDGGAYTVGEVVDYKDNCSIDSSYAATYWPWVKFFDKDENVYVNLPVTKDVVRNLAYVDNTSYPWYAPAGINRGDVNCVRAAFKTRLSDEDALYDASINPVKTFAEDGVKIWGNKTMYSEDSPLNRINVRRLMLRIKKLISNVGKQLIFDQYDSSLKNQFLSLVTPILSNVKANGGIYDYRIDVDDSVEARDAHTLPCTIHVKPTPTLEYIDLTFTIYPESVDFRD